MFNDAKGYIEHATLTFPCSSFLGNYKNRKVSASSAVGLPGNSYVVPFREIYSKKTGHDEEGAT